MDERVSNAIEATATRGEHRGADAVLQGARRDSTNMGALPAVPAGNPHRLTRVMVATVCVIVLVAGVLVATNRRDAAPISTGTELGPATPNIGPDAVYVLPTSLPADVKLRVAEQNPSPTPTALTVTGILGSDGRASASITAIEESPERPFVPRGTPNATVNEHPAISAPEDLQLGIPVVGVDGLTSGRVAVLGRGVELPAVLAAAQGITYGNGTLTFDMSTLPAGFATLYTGTSRGYLLRHEPSTVLEYDTRPDSHRYIRISAANDPTFDPRALLWEVSDARIVSVDGREALHIDSYSETIQAQGDGLVVAVNAYGDDGPTRDSISRSVARVSPEAWADAASQATGRLGDSAIGSTIPQ
jgi:hypothetical protein